VDRRYNLPDPISFIATTGGGWQAWCICQPDFRPNATRVQSILGRICVMFRTEEEARST